MKKVFTFLMAMMIVMASFAQHNQVGNVTIKTAPERISSKFVKKTTNNIQDKNAASSFWFEYGEGLANVMQLPDGLDGAGVLMCKDTNSIFNWSSGPGPAQFQSTGHVYDWTHSCWNSFYYGNNFSNVPALWGTDNYSIDSLELVFGYFNAPAVAANVVDTLKVMYIINLDNEGIHNYRSIDEATLDTLWVGAALWLPIDPNTCMPTLSNAPWGGSDNLNANVQIFEQTFLLHQADTSDNWIDFKIATPEGMSNLSCNRLAVFYTYIPGTEGAPAIIDSNSREFIFYAHKDPRDEYTNGGDLPKNDLNMNYSACYDWTLEPTHPWYVTAMPDFFWLRNRYHTYMGLYATCSDCAIVNVEEMDKNNVTIYPNPATTEITVNNPTNERTLVEMFNLVGQKVYSEQFVNTTKINVSNMKAGVYMLKVNNHTTKVVVR